ncbi:MAG: alginate export family protein [Bacteroidetes bacterium]|nr:alginate export family protein [Bacteroidota bacterium]
MKNKKRLIIFAAGCLTLLSTIQVKAQLTAGAQIRNRSELRSGQGAPIALTATPAFFISQRTRLSLGYTGYRFKLYTAVQDVRVWGQDASTNNRTTTEALNGIMLHEAWGEIMLNDTMPDRKIQNVSLKIGRQEISYDDQKLLGGLDWLQQARRHDAIVLKVANKSWMFDVGAAYNQNKELASDAGYVGVNAAYPAGTNAIGTMYKSMQYAYLGKKFFFGNASLLCFKDDFSKYTKAGAVTNYGTGVWSRITTGLYLDATIKRKFNIVANFYHQSGTDKDGVEVNANLASVTTTMQFGRKFFAGLGFDYLSGNDGTVAAPTTNNRFDPLYGTPHKFWGYMDYFYVASGFGKQGLVNMFFKMKYNAKDNLTFFVDVHGFQAANKVSNGAGGVRNPYLGTEIDFMVRYNLTKIINFEAGYSAMFQTSTMTSPQVKSIASPMPMAHWAYLQVNIKPNLLAK